MTDAQFVPVVSIKVQRGKIFLPGSYKKEKATMKKKSLRVDRLIIFFVFTGIISQSCFSQGAEFLAAISDWPPHIIFNADGTEAGGIDVEILKELANRANFTLKCEKYPFKRCLMMLEEGNADIVCSLLKRPEREQFLSFIEPPYFTASAKVFYLRKGKGSLIRKHEDLYNLSIGVMSGFKYFPLFDDDPKIRKYAADTQALLLKMLANERFDAFIETETVADYFIVTEGFKGQFEKSAFRYDSQINVYMAVSKKSRLVKELPRLNQIMGQIVTEGKPSEIRNSYLKRFNIAE